MGIEGAGVVMARRDLGPSIRGRIHCRDRFERQWALMARRIRDLVSQPSIRGRWWREVRGRCGRDAGRAGPAWLICGSGEEQLDLRGIFAGAAIWCRNLPSAVVGGEKCGGDAAAMRAEIAGAATFHPRALLARQPSIRGRCWRGVRGRSGREDGGGICGSGAGVLRSWRGGSRSRGGRQNTGTVHAYTGLI
jgi:hypothetical protein